MARQGGPAVRHIPRLRPDAGQGRGLDRALPHRGDPLGGTWRGDLWPHDYTPVEREIIRRSARWGPNIEVYGDWQGSTMNVVTGAHSAFKELEKYGISVTPVKVLDDYESIVAARELMRHMRADARLVTQRNGDAKWCPTFGEVLTQWKYPKPQPGMTSKTLAPVHDRYCHGGDCVKMLALTIDLPDAGSVMSVTAGKAIGKRGSDVVRGRFNQRYS
jgi:hypothetical protein